MPRSWWSLRQVLRLARAVHRRKNLYEALARRIRQGLEKRAGQ
ncbi:hypothetical protein [Hymenobacter sp. PAMC 26628]|nr:hypothetical protein [Hymenobacter sp. PAMC 26628]